MISLPATDATVLAQVIDPALDVLPPKMRSDEARCLLLAIGRQESGFAMRVQRPVAHARGLWPFEQAGVAGVLSHRASSRYVHALCTAQDLRPAARTVWVRLRYNDVLAACLARLLLWTDPRALPRVGRVDSAWKYYLANWRPGKPGRARWDAAYGEAMKLIA